MFARHELPRQVRLTDSRFEQPLSVDMQAFFEFSFDLAEDLLDLEAKYAPAPTGDCFDMAAKQAMWM